MTTITVKNIPDDVYSRLKKQAKYNRRSVNSEVIVLMERATIAYRTDADAERIFADAKALRDSIDFVVTEEDINHAKNEGRP